MFLKQNVVPIFILVEARENQKFEQKKSRTKKSGLVMKVPLGQTSRGEHLPRAMGGGTAVSDCDMYQLASIFNP